MFPTIPASGFLRLPQILAIFPISKSAWWDGCRTGRYPTPVKLGPRTTVWRTEDITALVQRLGGQQLADPDGKHVATPGKESSR